MSVKTITDLQHVTETLDMLRRGPASLNSRAIGPVPDGVSTEQHEAVRAELFAAYQLWLESWVTPRLEALYPTERREAIQAARESAKS